jgi:iron complex outermembrane recepter protein
LTDGNQPFSLRLWGAMARAVAGEGPIMFMSRHASLYLGASALALLSNHAALAQAVTQAAAPEGVPEQVVVTGSLLGASNFAAPTPVTQVSQVQVETRALTGVGTVIEELPFATTGQGLTRNTNGIMQAAQSLPDLRGLGSNNTLVLIDGMRPTPVDVTNNFDTNMIPQSMLDRFEIVTTGASATYGSDAVAGVINFILKDHLEGFTSDVRFGVSQRGDEDESFVSLAWGTTLLDGRGHFEIGGEWANQFNTVNMYARPWGREEPGLVSLTASTATKLGLPANILTNNAEVDSSTQGGLITGCANASGKSVACPSGLANITFSANGNPAPFQFGTVAGSSYMIGTSNYGQSGLNRQLSPPYERWAGLARFEYDITPDTTAFAMINYGELQSNDPSQGAPFPVDLTILSGNPFIPPSIQAAMSANKISSITLAKENIDGLGTGNTAGNKNILVQSFFGVKGNVFNDWNWDVQGGAGRTTVWQSFLNVPVTANLDAAAYVVPGPNGPVCGPLATNPVPNTNPGNSPTTTTAAQVAAQAAPGCVPYNPFGVPSAASIKYLNIVPDGPDGSESNIRQYMAQADVNGPIFNLPAGPVDVAFGGNYRYDSFDRRPTPPAAAFLYEALNPQPLVISQSVKEAYGETGIPLLRDLPFVKAMDFNAAGRYTDYSITGGVYTWKYGGTWDVFDWLRLRATRSQDIRAPNFSEISVVPTGSATNLQNPITGVSERVSGIETSGSPTLHPEISQNETAGVVIQPTPDMGPVLSGFRASVDYYRIRIAGQIASDAPQDVINRCLLQQIQQFCSQIVFAPGYSSTSFTPGTNAFGITTLDLHDVNLSSLVQDGLDFNISQRLPLDGTWIPGTFQLSALASYIDQQTVYQTSVGANGQAITTRTNYADIYTAPRWSGNFNFTYFVDRFTGNLQLRYYSPIKYIAATAGLSGPSGAFNIGPEEPGYSAALAAGSVLTINRDLWPAAITWNLALSYDLIQEPNGEDLQVYLNIDNLLDKDPPIIWWYVSNYDVVGRYFKIGVRYTLP